jgi:Protein of unknown function (DUF3093)
MRVYRERLGVPALWWLAAAVCVLLLGTTLWAGLSISDAVWVYAVMGGATAATLLAWGSVSIEVTDAELRSGSQRLPLRQAGLVAALDAAQARELRGPGADPAAYLLIRPYLPEAVYVELAGKPPDRPYWLLGTRHPAQLAAAIERARPQADRDPSWHDVADDQAAAACAPLTTGQPQSATAPRQAGENGHGKDPNAW